MLLRLEPIAAGQFAPFGQLIAPSEAFERINLAADVANLRSTARANLATVRLPATDLPIEITQMERHDFSTQAFLPLDVSRYIVVVAPDKDDAPDITQLTGFVVAGHLGISYAVGTWHMGMMVIDRAGSMVILVHEDGSAGDCAFRTIAPVQLVL